MSLVRKQVVRCEALEGNFALILYYYLLHWIWRKQLLNYPCRVDPDSLQESVEAVTQNLPQSVFFLAFFWRFLAFFLQWQVPATEICPLLLRVVPPPASVRVLFHMRRRTQSDSLADAR